MKYSFYSLLCVLTASLLLSSCIKKGNKDWTSSKDNAISSELYQDLYRQIDEAAQSEGNLKSCPNITMSDTTGNFPNTVTIEFDSTGCLGTDGRTRKGTIQAIFTGRWRAENTSITITLDNYQINDNLIEGTITITNNGNNNEGHLSYTMSIVNGKITDSDGNITQWSGTTNYEWVAGQDTDFASSGLSAIQDDVYHITGSANGINRKGTPYTATITNALVRKGSCKWITKGTIEIEPEDGDIRTIDFGNGDCDANVTLSFRRLSVNFILP